MPNIQIRWSDNTSELRKNLKDGVDVINATKAAAEKLAQSLSGENMLAAAQKYAAAVNQMGGAAKLVGENQARVNDIMSRAVAHLEATGQGSTALANHFRELANATKQIEPPANVLGTKLAEIGKNIATTAAGFVSAQAVMSAARAGWQTLTTFVSDSVKAYADAEAAQKKLTVAMQAQGTATPEAIAAAAELAGAFQKTTRYSDDTIQSMQALLVTVGDVMPAQMGKALEASTNLAAGLGIDLEQATMMVAKAATGHTTALEKYGVTISDATKKSGDFGAVLDAVNDRFSGQAAADAATYAGRIESIANAWNNFQESVGKLILTSPITEHFLTVLKETAEALDKFASEKSANTLSEALKSIEQYAPPAIGELSRFVRLLEDWATAENNVAKAAKFRADLIKPLASHDPPAPGKTQAQIAKEEEEAKKKLAEANKKLTETQLRFTDSVRDATIAGNLSVFTLNRMQATVPALTSNFDALNAEAQTLPSALGETTAEAQDLQRAGQFLSAAMVQLNTQFATLPNVVPAGTAALEEMRDAFEESINVFVGPTASQLGFKGATSFGDGLKGGIAGSLQDFPSSLIRALEGGGGVEGAFKALGVKLGDVLINSLTAQISKGQGALSTALNGMALGVAGFAAFKIFEAATETLPTSEGLLHQGQVLSAEGDLAGLNALLKEMNNTLLTEKRRAEELGTTWGLFPSKLQAAIDTVTGLRDALSVEEGAAAFGPTKTQLNEMARQAQATYEFMAASSEYSAAQVQAAWEAAQKAIALANGETAAAAVTSLSETKNKTLQAIKDIETQYQTLAQGVAQEAPEEVAGVIETQMRGQMDALKSQSDELRRSLLEDGQIAADELERILDGIAPSPVHVPIEWDIPGLPTGSAAHATSGGIATRSGFSPFPLYAATGYLSRGTDTIPTMVSPGEMISSVQDTHRLIRMADAIVSGRAPMPSGSMNVGEVVQVLKGIRLAQAELPAAIVSGVSNAILLGLA